VVAVAIVYHVSQAGPADIVQASRNANRVDNGLAYAKGAGACIYGVAEFGQ